MNLSVHTGGWAQKTGHRGRGSRHLQCYIWRGAPQRTHGEGSRAHRTSLTPRHTWHDAGWTPLGGRTVCGSPAGYWSSCCLAWCGFVKRALDEILENSSLAPKTLLCYLGQITDFPSLGFCTSQTPCQAEAQKRSEHVEVQEASG